MGLPRRSAYALELSLGLIAVAFGPGRAHAELFSWVDAQGDLHFTDVKNEPGLRPYVSSDAADDAAAGAVRWVPYEAEDAEGFGGQAPLVMLLPGGEARTLYAVDVSRFDATLREAAAHYRLPFALLKAIAKVESNFNPRAVSPKQAKGLMQIIDGTAALLRLSDPFDVRQSAFAGARYLRMLANMFDGDLALTAAAYNAGPERVKRARGVPKIEETTQYVRRVLEMYRYYSTHGADGS